jgi:uncharacterized protein (TIGR02646 family)
MIHVERKSPPPSLNSPPVMKARKEAEVFFTKPPEQRKLKNHKFFPLSTKLAGFREWLDKTFGGKCAYCESLITDDSFSYMDRFRPTSKSINFDGQQSPQHYWWLAYEWTNIYMACFVCNKIRGHRFPVKGRRAEEGARGEALRGERRLLLDPCEDHPETLLVFDERGMVASEDERGRVTIEVFGLNRSWTRRVSLTARCAGSSFSNGAARRPPPRPL